MPSRTFHIPGPVRLSATVGAAAVLGTATTHHDGATSWRASRTPEGPGTIRLTATGTHIEAEAWGPGADWLLESAPGLAGADDRPEAFVTDHPLVRSLHRRQPHLRIGRSGRVFEAFVPAVLGQKVTTTESKRALSRLIRTYGEPAPGPIDLFVPPEPDLLASLPYYDYHPLGIEKKRAETIRFAAARARRLDALAGAMPQEATAFLTKLPGVGPWTAALVTGAALGDADAVPVGDFHIPNTVAWALAGEPRGDDARMLELLEPFAGHRGRVIRLLKGAGYSAPKYGPRTAPRSIRTM